MRIGVFGGSFDPVHLGHLRLADCCWRQAQLDRVEFVPTARQPLKPAGPATRGADRVAMLQRAIADRPEFAVSTVELDRGGVSYTVDTLRHIKESHPAAELYLLMGADSLADFPHWREPSAICELSTPLVVRRAGSPAPDYGVLAPFVSPQRLVEIAADAVEMPAMAISSSQIRQLVASAGDWQSFVPPVIAQYIEQHGIYGSH